MGEKNPGAPFVHTQTHTERAQINKEIPATKKKQQQGGVSHSCAQGKIRFDTGRTMHIISIIQVLYYTIPYHTICSSVHERQGLDSLNKKRKKKKS